jgi:hypothetical protein
MMTGPYQQGMSRLGMPMVFGPDTAIGVDTPQAAIRLAEQLNTAFELGRQVGSSIRKIRERMAVDQIHRNAPP